MFYCPGCQGGLGPTDDGRPQAPLGVQPWCGALPPLVLKGTARKGSACRRAVLRWSSTAPAREEHDPWHPASTPTSVSRTTPEQAMEFYRTVFGGELVVSTFGEFGDSRPERRQRSCTRSSRPRAATRSWRPTPRRGCPTSSGSTITVSLSGDDGDELRGYWDGSPRVAPSACRSRSRCGATSSAAHRPVRHRLARQHLRAAVREMRRPGDPSPKCVAPADGPARPRR